MADGSAELSSQLAQVSVDESVVVQKAEFSDRVPIRSIILRPDGGSVFAGQHVRVGGWVKTGRKADKDAFAFLELNDGSCAGNLQVIVASDKGDLGQLVQTGTCVVVDGLLKLPPAGAKQKVEVSAERVVHFGKCDSTRYPLPKARLSLEFLRDFVYLRARTNTISAVARIRSELGYATHTFFRKHRFVHVHTPIITTSDCEGAGEMFQVTTLISEGERLEREPAQLGIPIKDGKVDYTQDFFGRPAFLTVSGQLQLEAFACGLGDVYAFGPTFRAENSHTSRHLAEFWMVEPELVFAELTHDMNCAEKYVKYLCQWLLDNSREDMEFFSKHIDKTCIERLTMVASTPFVRVTYTEAVELLIDAMENGKKFENHVEWGIDLASEHERFLTEVKFQKPVIVYNYPKGIKAFYMRLNDDNKTVAAMDLLVPKVGELIGGSQREERYDVLCSRIAEMGLPVESYQWYLNLRRFGTVKHAGFGLGFERMLLFATGIENIRDVIPFPRYPGRADL